jgi:YjjI family glycine radical enzyme
MTAKTKPKIHQLSMLPFENFEKGLTSSELPEFHKVLKAILKAPNLIYEQQRDSLEAAAMRTLPYPAVSSKAKKLIQAEVIELISEGGAPYHPRYVAPFYERLLKQGSKFMELQPARDLYEATASLLTAYHYIPSAGLPVFIGRLDELLEHFYHTVTPQAARSILRSFWLMVDRLNPSAFVHANIGPQATKIGQLLLEIDRELKTITNLSLRYDPLITPDDFALQAVQNQLLITKPYFVNHPLMVKDWGEDYVIASCYNGMRLGGGIYTLVRLNFKEMVKQSDGTEKDVLERIIPEAVKYLVEVVNSRIIYLVEENHWFDHSFWVEEGLLDPKKFTAYLGAFGLAEAVNWLMVKKGRETARYGSDPEANALAERIVKGVSDELKNNPASYCEGSHGQVTFHAQVGISTDVDLTPGVRIPAGEEPELYAQLACEAALHAYIPGGCSVILEFDQTAEKNPGAVLDIAKGAMKQGIRILSIGSTNSEFVRVTGYLIRRADLENARQEEKNRHSSAALGAGFFDTKPNNLHRRERKV